MTIPIALPDLAAASFTGNLLHPFAFFAETYLATIVIALVSSYLGIFIALKRTVFVGVALAEVSAAGMAAAFYVLTALGLSEISRPELFRAAVLVGSLAFSLGGVFLFSTPVAERRVSREAIVGVSYATAAGLSILFVSKSAQGLEDLKNVLAGSVLFVNPQQLLTLAIMAVAVAAVHGFFRKEFIFCAFDPVMARTLGLRARAYDLLLFVTIGAAIAVSLRTGGVLTVFGFLVVPAQAGLLLGSRLRPAFLHAMAQAAVASALGLWASDAWNLPTGPAIVIAQSVLLVLSGAAARLGRTVARAFTLLEAVAATASALLFGFAILVFAGAIDARRFEAPHDVEPGVVAPAPEKTAAEREGAGPAEDLPRLLRDLGDASDERREAALAAIIALKDPRVVPSLLAVIEKADGAFRVHVATALARLGNERGVDALLDFLSGEGSPIDRSEALDALRALSGDELGYDPEKTAAENRGAIARWRLWRRHRRIHKEER